MLPNLFIALCNIYKLSKTMDEKLKKYQELEVFNKIIEEILMIEPMTDEELSVKIGRNEAYIRETRSRAKSKDGLVPSAAINALTLYKTTIEKYTKEVDKKTYTQLRFEKKNNVEDNTAPLIPVKAQAGYTRSYNQTDYLNSMERYALPPGITRHGATWAYWEIEGSSMEPTFRNKSIILTSQVHPMDWEDLRNFYVYVIVTDDAVCIKRVFVKSPEEWVMISDNEDNGYEQFIINTKDVKEVWVFRRHIDSKAPTPKQFIIKV